MKAEEFLREKYNISDGDNVILDGGIKAFAKILDEYAAMIFSEKVDETYQASQSPEPNTVTEPYHKEAIELVKKYIPNDALAKEYILEWLQQTQAVTELAYVECSERQATHYIIKEPGDSACYPVKLLNQKK